MLFPGVNFLFHNTGQNFFLLHCQIFMFFLGVYSLDTFIHSLDTFSLHQKSDPNKISFSMQLQVLDRDKKYPYIFYQSGQKFFLNHPFFSDYEHHNSSQKILSGRYFISCRGSRINAIFDHLRMAI